MKISAVWGFRRFRTRLLTFLLILLAPILGGSFFFVNTNNTQYTEETINTYLALGAGVFDAQRSQQSYTLEAIINSLTWDFGFRTAFAANDQRTMLDAAYNVLNRSLGSADTLIITDLEFNVLADTANAAHQKLAGPWLELLQRADASEDGTAAAILAMEGIPYQFIALPLYLPRQVAWIVGGFAMDNEFVEGVKAVTLSEVSILESSAGASLNVIESTLNTERQQVLRESIQLNVEGELQRIAYGGKSTHR